MSDESSQTSASRFLSRHFPNFTGSLEPKRLRRLARLRGEGRTFRMLKQVEAEWAQAIAADDDEFHRRVRILTLLKHRADFRRIIAQAHPTVIKLYLSNCPVEMVPLAVWLWGECADRFRLYGLAAYCLDPSPVVRKHVAKALRRLEAWTYLRVMAATYPDDAKIQWYAAAPTTHRPFAERLRNFKTSLDDSHASEVVAPSPMPFWAMDTFWSYTPPKSALTIRRMLRRIRHWLRWGVS